MLRPLRPGTGFLRPDAQKGISLRLQGLVGLPPKEYAGVARFRTALRAGGVRCIPCPRKPVRRAAHLRKFDT